MDTAKNLEPIDSLGFRNNDQQLILSCLLRMSGVFIFGYLFFVITEH